MEEKTKLTPAQKEYLLLVAEAGDDGRPTSTGYQPGKKLRMLRLCREIFIRGEGYRLVLTDKGKDMVQQMKPNAAKPA